MELKTLTQPRKLLRLILEKFNYLIPTEPYIKLLFRVRMGYKLHLNAPRTFNEKLQWLKLYGNKPEYTNMVDKAKVKEYVRSIIGEKYIIPTIAIWNLPEEIDFDNLPNQFVLKTTDGGGSVGVIVCDDKTKINRKETIQKLRKALKQNIWAELRERPYKDIKKRILAEQYLSDDTTSVKGDLNDYKFYCFNGRVTYCEVITGRHTNKQIDFFDLNWNHMPFTFEGRKFADNEVKKPECYDEMIEVAGKLCKNLPYSRIDMYVVHGAVYFGEITFFPASGFRGFTPKEWNIKLGDMIQLPNVNK